MLDDPLAELAEHGILLESAKGPIPNLADLVAGEPIKGSWWAHPDSHEIFRVINEVADSPDVVRLRLVQGRVTLVHRRLWPALVRLADRVPPERLAALHEEHTPSGAHRVVEEPFPAWVPPDVLTEADALTAEAAEERLPASLID